MSKVVVRSQGMYVTAWLAVAASIAVWTAVAVSDPGPNPQMGDYVVVAVFGVACVLLSLRATRTRIELTEDGITVYRLFRTLRVAWEDVNDVTVSYYGLHLICHDGRVVTAGSMGKSNWSTWLGRRTSADERADQVRAAVQAHRLRSEAAPEPDPPAIDPSPT